jgi:antitoxin (DNA-binding transcriptional repressor) of toxin-antitoxin stability system
MTIVDMLDAKTNLCRLVEAIEAGAEQEIIIARNGKPAARLGPIAKTTPVAQRIVMAKGLFVTPAPDPELDAEIAAMFLGEDKDGDA